MRARGRFDWALLGLLLLGGCGSNQAGPATAVVLRVDADTGVKGTMRALNVRIYRDEAGQWEQRLSRGWEIDHFGWPAELPIVPADDMLRIFEVVVEARAADGRLLAGTRAVTSFAAGEVTALPLFLSDACAAIATTCEPTASSALPECHGPSCNTCRLGRCVETEVTTMLQPYRSDEPVRDEFSRSFGAAGSRATN
jgi:hypothetical protein